MKRISNTVKGQFEVERKYSISDDEFRDLPEILRSHGFRFASQVYMTDTFVPPEQEGDMIRVRRETEDDKTRVLLTRKTWVEVQGNRERNEDEKQIDEVVAQTILELGVRLTGGAPLLSYSKERDSYKKTTDDGQQVTVTLDTVDDLGQ
ncbi:MAG TPA: CYTH domain-containing protein, partial [Chroococcales cyanobacterium]